MLVYGDVDRVRQPAALRRRIAEKLAAATRLPAGRQRHEALVMAFIEAGELVQGLADQAFARCGEDDVCEDRLAGARLLLGLAHAVLHSWRSGFSGGLSLPPDWPALLDCLDGPEPLRLKTPEGYAFYALYPESYGEAAWRSGLSSRSVVIGLRSIGTGLAAIVAAALGSRQVFFLRPTGHPFERHVRVGATLTEHILADPGCDVAIVDEGPGLSGSSFGSVADWLQSHGVSPSRIHFFPGHAGEPGAQASAAHRLLWRARPRHVVETDDLIVNPSRPEHCLRTWAGALVGARDGTWRDISGGVWRSLRSDREGDRPPSHGQMERRKFLMRAGGEAWLVKFAGLSDIGMQKLRRGVLLGEAGFCPRMRGLCHGFLVESWIDAVPGEAAPLNGSRIVDHLGHYLAFRACHLPAPGGGASLEALCHIALVNIGEACGPDMAETLKRRMGAPQPFQRRLRRVDTDNRLHRWEWLADAEGRIVKTDALDHNAAHDPVGCQDIAWDVAGACVEFDLAEAERDRLAAHVARAADCDVRADLLAVFEACYLGFQIGLWSLAAAGLAGPERLRIGRTVERYKARLNRMISEGM